MRVLLDTNIMLRAAQKGHPDSAAAQTSLTTMLQQNDELHIVPQVLYELWTVVTRPAERNGLAMSIPTASRLLAKMRNNFTLLPDPPDLLDRWQQLVVTHEVRGKNAHDARLVAAMQAHGLDHLLTFNTADFRRYPGLTVLSPGDFPT